MKHLKYFESKVSDMDVVERLMDRRKTYNIPNTDYKIDIVRPNAGMFGKGDKPGQSYRIGLLKDGKVISVAYLMGIEEKNGHIKAQVRRVHTENKYRGQGLASLVFQAIVDNFGDLDLYLHASPNRIDSMTDDNREDFRNKLFKFYSKFGFKKIDGVNKMVREPS